MSKHAQKAETKSNSFSFNENKSIGPEVTWAWNKEPNNSKRRYNFYTLFDKFESCWGKAPPKSLWDELWERSV